MYELNQKQENFPFVRKIIVTSVCIICNIGTYSYRTMIELREDDSVACKLDSWVMVRSNILIILTRKQPVWLFIILV